MSYVFITGIPASGKSFLAKKIADQTGAKHYTTDDWREEWKTDPALEPWVNFFWNIDEAAYYHDTSCTDQWANIVKQSEALWPSILKKINEVITIGKPAIFEGVNILPHLAARDLNFPGIILLGESFEQIFESNKQNPRWGETEELQRTEAEAFFNCERKWYESEAKKYGFQTFSKFSDAENELLKLLQK